MKTREQLELAVKAALDNLNIANQELVAFDDSIDNHTYDTIEDAENSVIDYLLYKAGEDCEGSYNYGDPEYTLEFMVGDQKYIGTLSIEYNRYDKTYYYIDGYDFEYKEV
jgi:hypothetical protein